jgi:hypothetical protein
MRAQVLAAVVALATSWSGAALADNFFSTLDAGYARIDASGGGGANAYSAGGAALYVFSNPGFDVQLNAGYDHLDGSGGNANAWTVDGDVFWRDAKGSIGGSFSYANLSSGLGLGANLQSYGAFGEWYATRDLTLQLKGGGFSGKGTSGGYVDGGAMYYLSRDFALDLNVGYESLGYPHVFDVGGGAEYMVPGIPVSFQLGYDYTTSSGGYGSGSTFLFQIKFRTGDPADRDLEGYHRQGAIDWNGSISPTSIF